MVATPKRIYRKGLLDQLKELVFDLATTFIFGSHEKIKHDIDEGLQQIGTLLSFERVVLFEFSDDGETAHMLHSYAATGVKLPPDSLPADAVASLSPDASALQLKIHDQLRGVLIFYPSLSSHLPEKLKDQLFRFGQVLGGVLERRVAERQVQQIEQFERLLSETSATYINLPVQKLTDVLKDDFARLSKTLGVDACILFIADESTGALQVVRPLVWYTDERKASNRRLTDWLKRGPEFDSETLHYTFARYNMGLNIQWRTNDEIPSTAELERQSQSNLGIKSTLAVPIRFAGSMAAILNILTTDDYRSWPEDLAPRLRIFGEVFVNAFMRKRSEERLQKALSEIKLLKERYEADYLYLSKEVNVGYDFDGVVGQSHEIQKVLVKAKQVAPTSATVLILGETGVGKGLIARAIHNASNLWERPLMQVNCAALAPNLIESELFGHEKGAFTGATARRLGRFEAAEGTTLFLDEIGDLPMELQAKLLRLLEEGEFERVGGNETIRTDVRLIAATSRNLEEEVAEGKFRQDLWYRLNIFPIVVPPLRERLTDVPLFVSYFVEQYGKSLGKTFDAIPLDTIKALQAYDWPGNIRELKNVIERAIITSHAGNLQVELLRQEHQAPGFGRQRTLKEIERETIIDTLERTHWKINGVNGAAQFLDIHPETLRARMRKHNIKRPYPTLRRKR